MYRGKEGQDKWVLEKLNNKREGYFVDVGASCGLDGNNTYVLEKAFGWRGICIEPNSYNFIRLQINRNCILENVCVSDIEGEVDFVERKKMRARSAIYNENADYHVKVKVEYGHPLTKKPSVLLNSILIKHNAPTLIDYLSIDAEGSEYPILSKLDFNKYKFSLITLEHNCKEGKYNQPISLKHREMIKELLERNGYKREVAKDYEDWYAYT
jgi:FkbM family methyltransferase